MKSADIVPFVRGWDSGKDKGNTITIQAIVSSIIARSQRRDNVWFAMAADEIGIPESVLQSHATHGNDLPLAILIHVICQEFHHYGNRRWPSNEFWKVLEAASKFDVLDTSPELQHEFCALWNEVVRANDDGMMPWYILKPIRNIYLMLHLHTDCAPTEFSASTSDEDDILYEISAYPLCNIPGHQPDTIPRIHDASTSTVVPLSALHNNAALVSSFPADAPSHSVITPDLVDKSTVEVPQIDNTLVLAPLSRAHQTAMGDRHDSASSPDPAATVAAQDDPLPERWPPPSVQLRCLPLLFLHLLMFSSRTTQTSWRHIRVHQRSHLQLPLNRCSTIYFQQVCYLSHFRI